MDYITSIFDAFKLAFSGQFSGGNIMVLSGVIIFIVSVILLGISFPKNSREREKMYNQLRNS